MQDSTTAPSAASQQAAVRSPGFGSWLIASSSAVLIGAGLYVGHLGSTGVYSHQQFGKFSQEVDNSPRLETIFENNRYEELVGKNSGVISELVSIDSMIAEGQFVRLQSATQRLRQLGSPESLALASALTDARSLDSRLSEVQAESESTERQAAQLRKDFSNTAFALATLLGYKASANDDPDQIDLSNLSDNVYEEGLLALLPKLDAIPDNIADMNALLKFIAPRRQRDLQFEMAQKRSNLLKEIDAMRDTMAVTLETAAGLEQRREDSKLARDNAVEMEKAHRQALATLVRATVKGVVKPKLAPRVELVTDFVCDLVTCSYTKAGTKVASNRGAAAKGTVNKI